MDRSIVHAMTAGAASRSMARAIAALARALHMRASAEGVETQAQLDCLRDEGFDEGQGFLLARPVDESQVAAQAARRPSLLQGRGGA
jgi:EAL domain-containing protein (putative c-di-GMP-specific phosphodiesterase class I)